MTWGAVLLLMASGSGISELELAKSADAPSWSKSAVGSIPGGTIDASELVALGLLLLPSVTGAPVVIAPESPVLPSLLLGLLLVLLLLAPVLLLLPFLVLALL
jgi:hypothetical protein